ncbi:MAG: NAD(P)-binding domain-containing protein [Kofleriaceae bacterium]
MIAPDRTLLANVTSPSKHVLPTVVIGAGPIGLAAAAHLVARGHHPIILEAGAGVGASMGSWGHVRMFSPWKYNIDPAAQKLLLDAGWEAPDEETFPTGNELIDGYLAPLSRLPPIAAGLRLKTRVIAVSRFGADKMKTHGRSSRPFVVRVHGPGGDERILASAVIDASGTYHSPNPLGADGFAAIGERAAANRITYGIPDILGTDRETFANKHVLVVGSGHSAFNALLDLEALSWSAPDTRVTWAIRRDAPELGGGGRDELAARGALGQAVQRLLDGGRITIKTGFSIDTIASTDGRLAVHGTTGSIEGVDEIIATTGFRPDLELLRELRLALDSIVESPSVLAPLIDPNLHSCGTVPPHGAYELAHPEEQRFFIVGMKSYGRAPTFLMLTGYEQVRSVVALLDGDEAAAREVQLRLPETGVCKTDTSGGSCCAPSPVASEPSSCCAPASPVASTSCCA